MNKEKLFKIKDQLSDAVAQFVDFYAHEPTDINKAGTIQAFEFTFELSWKLLREILKEIDNEYYDSPKPIIKLAGKKNIFTLEQVEKWILYTGNRNLTVHMYNKNVVDKIFKDLETFEKDVKSLVKSVTGYLSANNIVESIR